MIYSVRSVSFKLYEAVRKQIAAHPVAAVAVGAFAAYEVWRLCSQKPLQEKIRKEIDIQITPDPGQTSIEGDLKQIKCALDKALLLALGRQYCGNFTILPQPSADNPQYYSMRVSVEDQPIILQKIWEITCQNIVEIIRSQTPCKREIFVKDAPVKGKIEATIQGWSSGRLFTFEDLFSMSEQILDQLKRLGKIEFSYFYSYQNSTLAKLSYLIRGSEENILLTEIEQQIASSLKETQASIETTPSYG